jgi:hypothetical protein
MFIGMTRPRGDDHGALDNNQFTMVWTNNDRHQAQTKRQIPLLILQPKAEQK